MVPLGPTHDVNEKVIHQTKPPSSIGSWFNSDVHMLISVVERGSEGAGVCGCAALYTSEPARTFSVICATVAILLDWTTQACLCSPRASVVHP